MSLFNYYRRYVKLLSTIFAKIAIWILFGLVLLIVVDVFLRYVFKSPTLICDEISGYALVLIIVLSAGETLKQDRHVHVDIFVEHLSLKLRLSLSLFFDIISLGIVAVIGWRGIILVYNSFDRHLIQAGILLTPLYVPQIVIPLGFIVLGLQLVVEINEKFVDLFICSK